jgi:hypothetical protein
MYFKMTTPAVNQPTIDDVVENIRVILFCLKGEQHECEFDKW